MNESSSGARDAKLAADFRALFDAEFGYVWKNLRRLGVRERDLPDVTHDVFVTVHRRLSDFDPSRALRAWIFGIAYRIAADYRRLARHKHEVLSDRQWTLRTTLWAPTSA